MKLNHFLPLVASVLILLLFYACTQEPATPKTAMRHYLNNKDKSFRWDVKESYDVEKVQAFDLAMTSQTWHDIVWTHQLTVLAPRQIKYDGALLFITGGSNTDGVPNWADHDDGLTKMLAQVAEKNSAIVAIIRQVPNQPLFDGRTEDEIISLTLHNYREDKDLTWPLLFPMVKSAMRAMDAVQAFADSKLKHQVNSFVVSGASKRGWTTWLTSAADPRVAAIGPMVIDVLNMPVQMDYQIQAWGDYSPQIQDYVDLGIAQALSTPDGEALVTMIDPYSYREKYTMPKMIFIGTNDEYWPVDAVKHYINDIPGDNSIHYVANAGHDLGGGEQAIRALSAFFAETVQGKEHPRCTWSISEKDGKMQLDVGAQADALMGARLWTAESDDRDFRDAEWSFREIAGGGETIRVVVAYPTSGYKAFYVDLIYPDANGGEYSKSTRMFLSDNKELYLK